MTLLSTNQPVLQLINIVASTLITDLFSRPVLANPVSASSQLCITQLLFCISAITEKFQNTSSRKWTTFGQIQQCLYTYVQDIHTNFYKIEEYSYPQTKGQLTYTDIYILGFVERMQSSAMKNQEFHIKKIVLIEQCQLGRSLYIGYYYTRW